VGWKPTTTEGQKTATIMKQPRVFAGWWVVAGAFLCIMTGLWPSLFLRAFLFGVLESEFGARPAEDLAGLSISAFFTSRLGFPPA